MGRLWRNLEGWEVVEAFREVMCGVVVEEVGSNVGRILG